jgi:hypothetical protein
MRLPDPIANTTTEAYLAYKAGVLAEGDLKPKLYDPYIHLDAWLAYWTGLVATYPTDKNGNPEMLTDEEAYIAYLSGVTDTYPEEFRDPADIRVAGYLRYLISARFGRPEYPVTNEELYLSMQKPPYVPSGDPSSDIVIEDTIKAPFIDVKMYGDTFQKTYTGSNLYIAKPYQNATQQGIKTTIKEGYIFECSGTSTTTYSNIAEWTNVSLPAGTYTFCIDHALTNNITMRLSFDPDTQDVTIAPGNTSKTVTVSSPIVAMRPFIATGGSGNVISETIKLNIVAGSTPATVFEPYVGGISSPNPGFQQPVQTVTGLQKVEVTGRNLFDKDNARIYALNPVTAGSALSPLTNACSTFIPITEGDTYTVSSTNRALLDTYASVYFISGTPDTATTWITRTSFGQNNSVTTTAPAGATYLGIYFLYSGNQTTIANAEDTIQVERGSTATEYTPFIKNIYPINLGKNLYVPAFTNPNVELTEDGFEITTSQTNTSPSWSAFATLELKLNPWTEYTLSKKSYVVEGNEYNHSGGLRTYIEGVYGGEKDEDSITFTTGVSGVVGILFYTGYLDTTQGEIYTKVRFENVQIEAGPNATSYAPHFEPIELCKLGSYQDYIWKDQDEWKIRKNTSRFTFKTRKLMGLSKQSLGFVYNLDNNPLVGRHIPLVGKCSHFDVEPTTTTWNGLNKTGMNSGGALWFMTTSTNQGDTRTSEEFAQWLVDAGVSFVYALETPTDITITNQALITQLEALVKGGSEEGTTYIKVSASDPNLPGLLYVEAAEDVD